MPQGTSISRSVKPRQSPPSTATIAHLNGLALDSVSKKGGMKARGIVPPPIIASTIGTARAMPAAPSSESANGASPIAIPTNPAAAQKTASASMGHDPT